MTSDDEKRASLIERAAGRLQQAKRDPAPESSAGIRKPLERQPAGEPGKADASVPGPAVKIDLSGLKVQGFLTPDGERTRVAEEFRIIKRPLLDNAFGPTSDLVPNGNLIVVTSSLPGEGKTFTAMNLAMSIAMEMDKTVLLIDADVGRARLHELLGVPIGPGLIDLLVDDSRDVSDVMLRTSVPKLRFIPMGEFHPHANELLASDSMQRLVGELATRYKDRVVIFDSPPILASGDSVVLAGLMGQVVFVVEANRTLRGHVADALSLIDSSKPVGLVLNQVRKTAASNHYGYGAYGQGYYTRAEA